MENIEIISKLKKDLELLAKRINALEILFEYSNETDHPSSDTKPTTRTKYGDYDVAWSLKRKFVYLLKANNRFLHFREAAKMIIEKEGLNIKAGGLASKLSAATSLLKKEKKIVKVVIDNQNQNTFWGIPDWLNDDTSIKTGHEYNKDYVSRRKELKNNLFEDI
jgi:hypothetical protein